MSQQVITVVCALLVCAAMGLSYWRHRKGEAARGSRSSSADNSRNAASTSVRACMDEVSAYFGVSPKGSHDRMSDLMDLTPISIASEIAREGMGSGSRKASRKSK